MACEDCGRGVENTSSEKKSSNADNQTQARHEPAIKDGGGCDSKGVVLRPECHKERHE